MPKTHKPRGKSLQFWPRVRARRILPSVNWNFLQRREKGLLGFVCYKAGMSSVIAKDLTPDSLTRNKQIVLPCTILECPPLKIYSVRFYKEGKVAGEVVVSSEKELKRKLKVPKELKKEKLEEKGKNLKNYDDIRMVVYTLTKRTGIKKTPDVAEVGLAGSLEEKFELAKNFIGKEISIADIFEKGGLVDVHGVTKGRGFAGPIKRFRIGKKQHKTEKGVRRPGSLGPWTPKRVSFRAPMAGQFGYFTRIQYNNKILDTGSIEKKNINPPEGFPHYGLIKTNYLLLKGSVAGPQKRPLMLTVAARPSKKKQKENFEILKLK